MSDQIEPTQAVIQADRDAALSTGTLGSRERYHIQQGKGDHYPIVQAFARHRQSEYARGLEDAGASRAKKPADFHGYGIGYADGWRAALVAKNKAIRNLKDQPR